MSEEGNWVRHAVITQLESLRRAGVVDLPRGEPSTATDEADSERHEAMAGTPSLPPALSEDRTIDDSARIDTPTHQEVALPISTVPPDPNLTVIQTEVAECTACDELASTRTQTVFGVGNPDARLVFLGEAPGADEDKQGEPFVGRAGQLLDKIIEACTLKREDVYILNILKCRPPGNRNPAPEEAANCRGFLDRQLAVIKPEYICCLGAVAAQNLLDTKTPIGKLRGRFHDYQGIRVICTYHPAYLLRDPSKKRNTWEDMQMLMAAMGIELPEK
ncbi:MAG: uracil-DNA glycosylase [Pirellulales bacterium]|nr:uracil-DNA glycosylase [Pirellulales bacterium]